jgi:hypothetical protein
MAKLGYTWYPKDWNNSDSVFELNLSQRGLYRELIDMAMLNDNKIEVNYTIWSRRWAIELNDLHLLLDDLIRLNLIQINDKFIFIPSCESRLNLVRGGSKGGSKSKPTSKPLVKPTLKPIAKQKKRNIKEIEIPTYDLFLNYAKEQKPKVNENLVKLKYDSWIVNEWKDGNGNKIVNWKSKLNNTLPYIAEQETKPKFMPLKF